MDHASACMWLIISCGLYHASACMWLISSPDTIGLDCVITGCCHIQPWGIIYCRGGRIGGTLWGNWLHGYQQHHQDQREEEATFCHPEISPLLNETLRNDSPLHRGASICSSDLNDNPDPPSHSQPTQLYIGTINRNSSPHRLICQQIKKTNFRIVWNIIYLSLYICPYIFVLYLWIGVTPYFVTPSFYTDFSSKWRNFNINMKL